MFARLCWLTCLFLLVPATTFAKAYQVQVFDVEAREEPQGLIESLVDITASDVGAAAIAAAVAYFGGDPSLVIPASKEARRIKSERTPGRLLASLFTPEERQFRVCEVFVERVSLNGPGLAQLRVYPFKVGVDINLHREPMFSHPAWAHLRITIVSAYWRDYQKQLNGETSRTCQWFEFDQNTLDEEGPVFFREEF